MKDPLGEHRVLSSTRRAFFSKRRVLFGKRRLLLAGVFLFLLAAAVLLFFKDRLVLAVVTRYFGRAHPEWAVRVKGLDVGWRRVRAQALTFKAPAAGPGPVWSGRVSGITLSYHPGRLLAPFPLALKEGEGTLEVLSGPGLRVEGAQLGCRRAPGTKTLLLDAGCRRLLFFDKEASAITGTALLVEERLSLTRLEARLLGAAVTLSGQASFKAPSFDMEGQVDVQGLDVAQLIRALKLRERMDATGIYGGRLSFAVRGGQVRFLSGALINEGGGRFHVSDASMLKGIGVGEKAGNIVVENLKDFPYDKGKIVFSLEGRNVKLDFMLDGSAGSRQMEVVWHGLEEGERHEESD